MKSDWHCVSERGTTGYEPLIYRDNRLRVRLALLEGSGFRHIGFRIQGLGVRRVADAVPVGTYKYIYCVSHARVRLALRFRGGLVFEAHRLLYHSPLGLRVIKKKRRVSDARVRQPQCEFRGQGFGLEV